MNFVKVKASKKSIDMRKPLYGVGVNDSWYVISKKSEGKLNLCPIYRTWTNMLMRCYRVEYAEKHPTYEGCFVCDDWLLFSNFYEWAESRFLTGHDLDKDLKYPYNKEYSPEKCLFVSKQVNYLILGKRRNSKYKQGVSWCDRDKRFTAHISIDGKGKHIGNYKTEDEASENYIRVKVKRILEIANKQTDNDAKLALICHAHGLARHNESKKKD